MPAFTGSPPAARRLWCVTAVNWLRAHEDGLRAPVKLACTHERTLDLVPLTLRAYAVDVPDDLGGLGRGGRTCAEFCTWSRFGPTDDPGRNRGQLHAPGIQVLRRRNTWPPAP